MNINELDNEELKAELEHRNIVVHHKTGKAKLVELLTEAISTTNKPEKEEIHMEEKTEVTPKKVATKKAKLTPEQNAMRLIRIIVSPNDSTLSTYPGLIFSAGNRHLNGGRVIKKFVPFNNDEGWMVPNILYKQIEAAMMQKYKSVKLPNGDSILEPYTAKKYNITVLEPLTAAEVKALAVAQQARGDA